MTEEHKKIAAAYKGLSDGLKALKSGRDFDVGETEGLINEIETWLLRLESEIFPDDGGLRQRIYKLREIDGLPLVEIADKLCISYGYARKLSSKMRRAYEVKKL